MFITLEGIDGSGKTSIAKMLKEYFENSGNAVYLTEEPTQIIFDVKSIMEKELDPFTRTFIFMADRVEHIKIIREKLNAGYVVICDRYVDSTFAYQGAILKNFFKSNEEAFEYMNSMYRPFALEPDKIIYLDVYPEIGIRRIQSRKREYFEKIEYLQEVRNFYFYISKKRNYHMIDSNSALGKVWEEIVKII